MKEIVSKWHFAGDTGKIVGLDSQSRVASIFELNEKTVLAKDLMRKWWERKPIEVTYNQIVKLKYSKLIRERVVREVKLAPEVK